MLKPRHCLLTAGLFLSSASLAASITPELKINGFATAGVAWLDDNLSGMGTTAAGVPQRYTAHYMQNSYGRIGISEEFNTKYDSVAGLQFDYQVNEQTNMVLQMVGKGQFDSFKPQAEWAYIRYAMSENWIARAGRVGFQGFMISDSMQVGHSYVWARPPAEVYANTPVASSQGLDITYRQGMGDWMFNAELFGGAADTTDGRLAIQDIVSLYLTLSHENLTVRGGALRFNLANNIALAPLPNLDDRRSGRFGSVGFMYDDGKWVFNGEFVQQRVIDWPADFDAGYVTLGYHFGRFLPYVYWAKIDTVNDDGKTVASIGPTPPAATPINTRPSSIFEQTTYAVGLRFDPKPGVSLKAQAEHITGMDDFNGMFRFTPGAQSQAVSATVGAQVLPELKSTNLFSLNINVAF